MKEVTLEELSSPGCHSCKAFQEFWSATASQFPNVKYREVSVVTPEGMEMAGKYGIFASPGIIINGELFSTGGFNKDKLLAKLRELSQ
ncbi:MAG: Uncharacterized protein G01um101472_448 [Parcubacteria group bacterium Gr01-1014_72]|nr:MAG: Uncharacterized protein G01um101472_448 [Parcubacteria group bacterium Gr01-1014_72]